MLLTLLRYTTVTVMITGLGVMIRYMADGKLRMLSCLDKLRNRWKERLRYSILFMRFQIIPVTGAIVLFFAEDPDNMFRYSWLAGPVLYVTGYALTKLKESSFLLEDEVISKKGDKWVRDVMDLWNSRQMMKRAIDVFTIVLYCVLAVSRCGKQQLPWIEFLSALTSW
ncbi:uncharacterized protein LOC110467180 [Mizuhopecten yessoensis]|uniref:uncharacterized protein LOC110467180 n=1 Tax=Mizuhopecten yessoensis TaxID=6573 RepID=UPI000B45D790|nr:uncharacterized protein LOC110467180 [Mizuhopecten yessoensis]